MPKYDMCTSQFRLADGVQSSVSGLITIAEPRTLFSSEARKGRLFIVTEPNEQVSKHHHASQLVATTVRKAFYANNSFSITSSLRQAIGAANDALYKYNFNAPKDKRGHVGLTCAVLKEGDLFLAQVAPAQAYILTEGKLRALPTHQSWQSAHISAAPFANPHALGASLYVDPELYRCELQANDGLILCSSTLAPFLKPREVETILRGENPDDAMEHLRVLCEHQAIPDAHAMMVKVVALPEETTEHVTASNRVFLGNPLARIQQELVAMLPGKKRPAREGSTTEESDTQPTAAKPRHRARDRRDIPADSLHELPPESPRLMSSFAPKPLPIETGESLEERHLQATAKQRTLPPSTFLGEGSYGDSTPAPAFEEQPPIDLGDLPDLAPHAQPYRTRFERRPLVDMTWSERLMLPFRWLGGLGAERARDRELRRLSPASQTVQRRQQQAKPRQGQDFPWFIFVLVIFLVAALILYGINISQRKADERTLAYLNEAEQRMSAVLAAPDDEAAAERLQQAEQALEEVRASPLITVTNAAFWLRYQDLQYEYERAQSSIYLLNYLDGIQVLAEHPVPRGRFASVVVPVASSSNVTETHLLEALRYVYALDGNSDAAQLYRIPREGGTPEPFLSPGQSVRGSVVESLRAQAWRLNNIVAVDEGNNGFGYYFRETDSWNYIRLGGSEIWTPGARIDLETYEGNLYVWGAEPNEILKFSSGRYGDIPQLWLDPAGLQGYDIGTSIDMDIDGYIYLLQPDGRILVMNLGRFEREIIPTDITPPLSSVTSFFSTGTPDDGWFFLVDTLGERIIQIDKATGQVVQQMKVRPESPVQLNQLINLYVDTSAGRPMLYLVNGGQILQVRMPLPPTPFEQTDEETPDTESEPEPDQSSNPVTDTIQTAPADEPTDLP